MATATKSGHSDKVKGLLRKGGFTEGSELPDAKIKALEALPADASKSQVEAVVLAKAKNGGNGGSEAKKVAVKYPEPVRDAYKAALALTGTPEEGGPKYALTVKQADAVKRALAAKGKAVTEVREALVKVSDAQLRKIAKGDKSASPDAVKAVRAFLKAHPALRDDRTMYGRKGAAIVLAYRDAE